MPLYEYRCEKCERVIEALQKFSDKPLRKCEACGGKLTKLMSRSGFAFKGSGWYVTDYKAGGGPGKADKGESSSTESSLGESGSKKAGAKAGEKSAGGDKPAAKPDDKGSKPAKDLASTAAD